MFNLAVFASGNGSNAENIIKYFKPNNRARVKLVASNKNSAKVITKSGKLGVPTILFSKKDLESGGLLDQLQNYKIDFIILAGFLLKVPKGILNFYKNKVVNIHQVYFLNMAEVECLVLTFIKQFITQKIEKQE